MRTGWTSGDPRPSLQARYPTRQAYLARLHAATTRAVATGLLLREDVDGAVRENLGLYDRILAHDPADTRCLYLSEGAPVSAGPPRSRPVRP